MPTKGIGQPPGYLDDAWPAPPDQLTAANTAINQVSMVSGHDPMRPLDALVLSPVQQLPPACPQCQALLHPVQANERNDVLFECLNDVTPDHPGYSAVYRSATRTYEPWKGAQPDLLLLQGGWKPPIVAGETAPAAPPAPSAPSPAATGPVGIVTLNKKVVELDGAITTLITLRGQQVPLCSYCNEVVETPQHGCAELQAAFDAAQPKPKKRKRGYK